MFQAVCWRIVKLSFLALWLVNHNGLAQVITTEKSFEWVRGIRLGCDLSRFAVPVFQLGRTATEFSIDTEIKRDVFPTFELGFENSQVNNDRISYKSNGLYGRAGLDYNILKRDDPTSRNTFQIGVRYGFSAAKQETDWNIVPNYWEGTPKGSSSDILGTHWMELVAGLKVEVLKNLFLGVSIRGRILFSATDVENYPYAIPGYGVGSNAANLGMNYSIYYSIPLMKVKVVEKNSKDLKK